MSFSSNDLSITSILNQCDSENERDRLMALAKRILVPAQRYFESYLIDEDTPLRPLVYNIFYHHRICNPDYARKRVNKGEFTAADLEPHLDAQVGNKKIRCRKTDRNTELDHLPWKHELIAQLPQYLETAEEENYNDLDRFGTIVEKAKAIERFYVEHKDGRFRAWVMLANIVMLLQPSSAAVERVFSQLKRILINFYRQTHAKIQAVIYLCTIIQIKSAI